jgi:thiamine-phosphate pyrophosphorylase
LQAGADYVTLSPIFASASKPGYGPALGLAGLAACVAACAGPVIALGGVTAATAPLCLAAGARGVAVMGEVMRADDPRLAVERLLHSFAR